MSKVEIHYDTKEGKGHVMVDGKKVPDVNNVYLRLVHPDEQNEYNKSNIEISHHTKPDEEGGLHKHGMLRASAGQDIDVNDPVGQTQGNGLTYNWLGIPIKSPDETLKEAIANLFKTNPNLLSTLHLNPQQVPHVVAEK